VIGMAMCVTPRCRSVSTTALAIAGGRQARVVEERGDVRVALIHLIPEGGELARPEIARGQGGLAGACGSAHPDRAAVEQATQGPSYSGDVTCRARSESDRKKSSLILSATGVLPARAGQTRWRSTRPRLKSRLPPCPGRPVASFFPTGFCD
jgi:hypothetical protein